LKRKYLSAFTENWPGIHNMGVDAYLGESHPPEIPIVRFYTWECPTISYGCHQKPEKRINLESCSVDGIPVVARPTGGRELLHGHDLCYSVIWPLQEKITAVEAKRLFAIINDALVYGLKQLGLRAEWNEFRNKPRALDGPCFAQIDSGEISIGGKKLIASAQRLFERCVVQQGSVPLRRPAVDLTSYLKHSDKESIKQKLTELSTSLAEQLPEEPPLPIVIQGFRSGFGQAFGSTAESGDELFADYLRNNNR
jgi:lipoyl(octanoyl) transferase